MQVEDGKQRIGLKAPSCLIEKQQALITL